MSILEILIKLALAYAAYDRAVNSENGLVIAISIGYLAFGGLAFLALGVLGVDPRWVNLAVGVIMLFLAAACRWHHWVPFKRW